MRHQAELIKTKYETEAKYLKTLEAKGSDNQRVQQNKLEQNEKNRLEYDKKLQSLNEAIAVSQNELSGQETVSKKIKELEKYESINIRINSAGCLDFCEQGPTVVVYPESIWYSIKNPEKDIPEIVQKHLINGKTVERWLIKL